MVSLILLLTMVLMFLNIINSFNYLFEHLSYNGLYIVEDLQTSYIPRYGGSSSKSYKKELINEFFKRLADLVNYEHFDRPFF